MVGEGTWGVYSLSEETVVQTVTDFFFPALVCHALYTTDLQLGALSRLAGTTVLVSTVLGLVTVPLAFWCASQL